MQADNRFWGLPCSVRDRLQIGAEIMAIAHRHVHHRLLKRLLRKRRRGFCHLFLEPPAHFHRRYARPGCCDTKGVKMDGQGEKSGHDFQKSIEGSGFQRVLPCKDFFAQSRCEVRAKNKANR